MRVQAAIISLVFCGLIQYTTCACSVSCTTDYFSSLNCSCLGEVSAPSCHLEAECWYTDEDEGERTYASCEMIYPQRWCEIQLDSSNYSIGADSECLVRVKNTNGEWSAEPTDSTNLTLCDNIKPQPPFNVSLRESDSAYNVSWTTVYSDDSYLENDLIYRVRIRIKNKTEPEYLHVHENTRYLEIPFRVFQCGKEYVVDVQARANDNLYMDGFWSEWSPTTEWKTSCKSGDEGVKKEYRLFFFLLLIVVPCVLCYFKRSRFWLKKVHVYIPSPEDFFRPLYHACEGDFKKWVGPTFTFSESDFLEKNTDVPLVKEMQLKSLEKLCDGEADESTGPFHSSCKHSCCQGPDFSAGHISIDTVTVSGEDHSNLSGSQDPYRGSTAGCFVYPAYSPGESMGSEEGLLGTEGRREAIISGGCMSGRPEMSRAPSSPLGLDSLEWRLEGEYNDLEQLSLDISEHSEEGYPRVVLDMDTIDSGFLDSDCSSPVHSDLDGKEQMNAVPLAEVRFSHTNYVKQWVATTSPSAVQADSTS